MVAALRTKLASLKGGRLDEAFASGELHRLIDGFGMPPAARTITDPMPLPPTSQRVPLINWVTAGEPGAFTDLGYPARAAESHVEVDEIGDPDAFAARVVGDSMAPQYCEGDIVVFSPGRTPVSGCDCFVRLEPDHEVTFKRVFFEHADGQDGSFRLQPLNPRYKPRTVPREEVAGLFVAVRLIRTIEP